MSLRARLAALELRNPSPLLLILDDADRKPTDARDVIPWPGGKGATTYAQRGESADSWAARVGFDLSRWRFARLPHLSG